MKSFIIAALIALAATPALADGFSCSEMAQLIKDLEAEKKAGGMSNVRKETVNGILSATRKSYDRACRGKNTKEKHN